jgi:RES domain-containing protein
MRVWRIGTDTASYLAEDLGGMGAKRSGGRWNRPGRAVLYCADTPSLAYLETLVHPGTGGLPLNRYLLGIDIPADVWKSRETRTAKRAPAGWDAIPYGKASLDFGDAWIASNRTAILTVPSVICPQQFCVLINHNHPDTSRIKVRAKERWLYDVRFGELFKRS